MLHDDRGKPYLHIVDGDSSLKVPPRRGGFILVRWARDDWDNTNRGWHELATTARYLSDELSSAERYRAQDACAHLGWRSIAKALRMHLETLQRVIFDTHPLHKSTSKAKHHAVRAWLKTVGNIPPLPRLGDPILEVECELVNGQSRILECPFCGSTHFHGWSLGSRAAHCRWGLSDRSACYILVRA